MEKNGYSFLIMVKGMKDFIRETVIENQGSFENSRGKYIDRYDLYGTTVRRLLYEGDTKKRNIHICKLRSNGMPVPLLRNGYSIFNGTKYR